MREKTNKKTALSEIELLPNEKVIEVEIEGRAPGLLMHNPMSRFLPPNKTKAGIPICCHGIPLDKPCNECLEARAYRTASGDLCFWERHMFMCLVGAARGLTALADVGGKVDATATDTTPKSKRTRKIPVAPLLGGTMRIYPSEISLGKKKWDAAYPAWVVINKVRVLSHRPLIKQWKAKFYLIYDTRFWGNDELFHDLMVDAGIRKGILDFRPEHLGPFGTFIVTKWQVL